MLKGYRVILATHASVFILTYSIKKVSWKLTGDEAFANKPSFDGEPTNEEMMSAVRQDLLKAVKILAPPLTFEAHKGQAGRIGVIGGSIEYTGAPYFAAITAMKSGADLGHVFCPDGAAQVIKSYSPDLIVHPLLSGNTPVSSADIISWFPRLHSIVIGPGLGRDPSVLSTVKKVLESAKVQDKDVVIDADGLYLIQQDPEVILGYQKAILSPNLVEFNRLYEKMFGHIPDGTDGDDQEQTKKLAKKMGGITILRKGRVDIISNGNNIVTCDEIGTPRREGGQGDLLSGSVGLFIFWARLAETRLTSVCNEPLSLIAAYCGCVLVKKCANRAYKSYGRAMLASDMVKEIPAVISDMFDECTVN